MRVTARSLTPALDVRLLAGFDFACRPDCGLCCYAEPRVEPAERSRLLAIEPETEIVGGPPGGFLRARGDGGACPFLAGNRCRVHRDRPSACREFPVSVHLGRRLQASVVLSCPGVTLGPLSAPVRDSAVNVRVGFVEELGSVRARIDSRTERRRLDAGRRRRQLARKLDADGRWVDEEEVRRSVRRAVPSVTDRHFPVDDPPEAAEGLAALPLFFDGRAAPVAIAGTVGGWELLQLREEGGVAHSLGVFPPPRRPPTLTAGAQRLLTGYLRYWLERDALFGLVLLDAADGDEGDVTDWVRDELCRIGAVTLSRASVRAQGRKGDGSHLDESDVALGIRAADQDLLDRPTWGDRL
jgi:hypothetical protein